MNMEPAATERLALSRARLREAMNDIANPPGRADGNHGQRWRPTWLTTLLQTPRIRLLMTLSKAWWARHPLRVAMPLVAHAADVALRPTAQRYPVALVLGAASAGAALAWVRPWRWLSVTALLGRFAVPLLSEMVRHGTAPSAAPSATTR